MKKFYSLISMAIVAVMFSINAASASSIVMSDPEDILYRDKDEVISFFMNKYAGHCEYFEQSRTSVHHWKHIVRVKKDGVQIDIRIYAYVRSGGDSAPVQQYLKNRVIGVVYNFREDIRSGNVYYETYLQELHNSGLGRFLNKAAIESFKAGNDNYLRMNGQRWYGYKSRNVYPFEVPVTVQTNMVRESRPSRFSTVIFFGGGDKGNYPFMKRYVPPQEQYLDVGNPDRGDLLKPFTDILKEKQQGKTRDLL